MASAAAAIDEVESSASGITNVNGELSPKSKHKNAEEYQGPHEWRKILRPIDDVGIKSPSR